MGVRTSALPRIWIDRGGTFTDCIAVVGEEPPRAVKILSSDDAPLQGIRELLRLSADEPIPPCDIRMGTTLGTNALLERRGARTALVITAGFGDLLLLHDQTRPHLFSLDTARSAPLCERVLEVSARLDASGKTLSQPNRAEVLGQLRDLRRAGIESVAIAVVNSYINGTLEEELGELATQAGFRQVSLSHRITPERGLLRRTTTAVLDAYLTPVLSRYLAYLETALSGSRLWLMQSSGGLTQASEFRGPDALLSGPAGGVVACQAVLQEAGVEAGIAFDMGGTSTDVARVAGELARVYESQVADTFLAAPTLDIHTVAAGGGSICRFDGARFYVGPESAGADPGPLCYGKSEAKELTLTDVNLFLGRLQRERFPFALRRAPVEAALASIQACLEQTGQHWSLEAIAQGFIDIANENMARAVRKVSVERGFDVADHALVVFGGAGGQHACEVARLLGIQKVLAHPLAGVLSAYGMGVAPLSCIERRDISAATPTGGLGDDSLHTQLRAIASELEERGRERLYAQGARPQQTQARARLSLSYAGTETELEIDLGAPSGARAAFEAEHQRLFGYCRPEHALALRAVRVEVWNAPGRPSGSGPRRARDSTMGAPSSRFADFWLPAKQRSVSAPIWSREDLREGESLSGPAWVLDDTSCIVVDPGFRATLRLGLLELRPCMAMARPQTDRSDAAPQQERAHAANPVVLELMNNRLMGIAEQMGEVLRQTALSTNIRERLDFSCAIFDASGDLIANAPHVPVHLGAMSETVKAIAGMHPTPNPGDAFAANAPELGGSHLPDITVVSPVHVGADVQFYVASRGHHADIGGISPGSMPAHSRSLAEEGVVFRGEKVVAKGRFLEAAVRSVLVSGPYPARAPSENVADLQAQIAANHRGAQLLNDLAAEQGAAALTRYMGHLLSLSDGYVRELLTSIAPGHCTDTLEDGTPVGVRVGVEAGRLHVELLAPQHPCASNLGMPRAVGMAAVLYVLRLLLDRPVPLNSGCLRAVRVSVPDPSVFSPQPAAAIAGGNVETSQRVVDLLLGALGVSAASQGTMNNLSFGNERFGYYETVAGGAGAYRQGVGGSAVQSHMTNTRTTDVEVLEACFPVRLQRWARRRGSGGKGRHDGGDGCVRELEFLAPLRLSLLSGRRRTRPFGLLGGHCGEPGRNLLNGADLGPCFAVEVKPGDRLTLLTPGGGGFGPPTSTTE